MWLEQEGKTWREKNGREGQGRKNTEQQKQVQPTQPRLAMVGSLFTVV